MTIQPTNGVYRIEGQYKENKKKTQVVCHCGAQRKRRQKASQQPFYLVIQP